MADKDDATMTGCGGFRALYYTVFGRRTSTSPRKSSSANATPRSSFSAAASSKRRRAGSDQSTVIVPHVPPTTPPPVHAQTVVQRQLDYPPRKPPPGPTISGELDSVIYDYQRSKASGSLVRASSSNVMLFGNLGNLRCGNSTAAPSRNVLDYLPMTAEEIEQPRSKGEILGGKSVDPGEMAACRVLSRRLDPETLKSLGDGEYENGRFAEALGFYEQAAKANPAKSAYWAGKAAALAGLGRFLEAAVECREAVRVEPSNSKAHLRLAGLYLRLGEAEKAGQHYRQAGGDAAARGAAQSRALLSHLGKANEARKRKDWLSVLKEAQSAVSAGADSAPQVFALQAEALLKLERYEEAETALIDAPTFEWNECTKFYGSHGGAYLFMVRSLVDLASGRFDDALSHSQRAAQLDPSNREVAAIALRARAVSSARSKGNDLFKASKYSEANLAYGEGLHQDPQNPVLLCNRAACRSKLRQWEKAIEDCTLVLSLRPSYAKARLRRADCFVKLERWDEAVKDYESLVQELPGDEEVVRALAEAQSQLKRRDRGSEGNNTFSDLVAIKTTDQLSDMTKSKGVCVVFYGDKESKNNQIPHFLVQLCKRHPSVHFVEMNMEDNPKDVSSEGPDTAPTFRVYKDGSLVKDLYSLDLGLLEGFLESLQ
ncbi:inactive TPR repeat-containing thioredoxin TTL3-like [Wolffia australiana]